MALPWAKAGQLLLLLVRRGEPRDKVRRRAACGGRPSLGADKQKHTRTTKGPTPPDLPADPAKGFHREPTRCLLLQINAKCCDDFLGVFGVVTAF